MIEIVVLLIAACVVGAIVGVLLTVRALRAAGRAQAPGAQSGLSRLRAQIHTGSEQTTLALMRELQLPLTADGTRYGDFYLTADADGLLVVRSRSVIDRGLVASITLRRARGYTAVGYAIVRLPSDESLHAAVLAFELRLIGALRRIDEAAEIRLSSTALRDLDRRAGVPESALEERAAGGGP